METSEKISLNNGKRRFRSSDTWSPVCF